MPYNASDFRDFTIIPVDSKIINLAKLFELSGWPDELRDEIYIGQESYDVAALYKLIREMPNFEAIQKAGAVKISVTIQPKRGLFGFKRSSKTITIEPAALR